MPTELREHQHELLDEAETLSLVFGTTDTHYLTTDNPTISGGDDQTSDVGRVREDGLSLGEDYRGAKTANFTIAVLSDDAGNRIEAGSDRLAAFEAAWKHPKLRNASTRFAILRSNIGGTRTRRAYGRPRRYEETTGALTSKGMVPLLCDFIVPDGKWYDDEQQQATIVMRASSTSGLVAPLTTPLTTTTDPIQATGINVGGESATWPVVTINGPIIAPVVKFNQVLTIGLDYQLEAGESITVDPRPWRRTVTREDGANVAGVLTWETPRMVNMALEPGHYEVSVQGVDMTGTSSVDVVWNDAYPRW